MNEQQQSHNKIYSCFFMDLYEDEVLLPNNKKSTRIYIEHPGAAAVLPITNNHKVLLIKQFRYPIHKVTIEIPAGKKDSPDESGLDCVTRELEEETGYQAKRYEKFIDIHNCLGYSNELIELFFAYDIYPVDNPIESDDDEFIEYFICDQEEVEHLLKTNKITDAKTIIALQEYLRRYRT
ncbi:NUDIX domain-containing protein [Candidatus Xianfuyuplasma coldseepsis]|uniref:NUDIX hydrolase n=1 Tax=Candidatus Xianfuyuplasma coldseepsis TaxID=2782163 RepID=A0A7L7KP68_9MOLU|nr:NUDIX hydrolase [Xianfuyuplasma coldseepsis]QMS84580.1 NUDIX hydrolase [Xianfuyuplasma coldseepsis]